MLFCCVRGFYSRDDVECNGFMGIVAIVFLWLPFVARFDRVMRSAISNI